MLHVLCNTSIGYNKVKLDWTKTLNKETPFITMENLIQKAPTSSIKFVPFCNMKKDFMLNLSHRDNKKIAAS